MKHWERRAIFTENAARLILWGEEQGYRLTMGEVYRTPEQAAIYAAKGIGIKDSLHSKGLAVDFNLFINGEYRKDSESHARVGAAWEALHPANRWGGRWGDCNHYEMREKE
jgi:hypothetical protein